MNEPRRNARRRSLCGLLAAASGCRGDVPTDATEATESSSSVAETAHGESSSGSVGSTTNSTTSDVPGLVLCTDGAPPVWCFERRELAAGGIVLDLDADGLADATTIGGDGVTLPTLSGFRNTGDAMLELEWVIELPFASPFVEAETPTRGQPPTLFVGSANELDTPLLVLTADASNAQIETEIPLAHNWTFGGYALLDMNNDEIGDIVIIASGAARMIVLLGAADGGYDPQPELELADAVFGGSGWAVGDVDGDGNTDLLTSRTGTVGPTVYFGDGVAGFTDIVDVPAGGRWPVFVEDIDGDGRGDVLTRDAFGFSVAYSEPNRSFRVVEQGRGEDPVYNTEGFLFIPADLGHDGSVEIVGFQDDMVWMSKDGTEAHYEARLHVYSDLGTQGFATDRSLLIEDTCDRHAEVFSPTDRAVELDGDGEPDFVFRWTTYCPEDLTKMTLGLLYRPQ